MFIRYITLIISAVVFAYLVTVTISNEIAINDDCTNVTSNIPMWSWGFARSCCHIHPNLIGRYDSGHEGGKLDDPTYIMKREIANNTVIYIATTDFPHFLDIFFALPDSYRVVIVTGCEDIGVPNELWHRGRYTSIWHENFPPNITMNEFVSDRRLVKWFTQNYDLNECNSGSCSELDVNQKLLLAKIHPIPIGIDFHSTAGKNVTDKLYAESVCEQRKDLDRVRAEQPLFPSRPLKALAAFSCHNENKRTRGEICRLLREHKSDIVHSSSSRSVFWRNLGGYAFSLSPAGHGIDTHRLWEILQLQSVPIVMSSTLDILYSQYPVIIIKNWTEVFEPNILSKYKEKIQLQFGENPFAQESITSKLTAKYWIELVRNTVEHRD